MKQPDARPTSKVTAAGLGGAVAVIVAWLLGVFAGVEVPTGVEGAFAVLAAWVAAYAKEETR